MKGYISSIESMGLVDGPGIRTVVFLSGCPLRCLFCHNPEMWNATSGEEMADIDLVNKIKRNKPYFKNNGGVTFSGGEPLNQPEFLLECLKLCKEEGIHTCLDTSGTGNGEYDEILDYVDLVILDVKAYLEDDYKKMTGFSMDRFNTFLAACQKKNKKLWLRQVVVPTINDTKEYILGLKEYISKIKNVEKVELLPYHTMGIKKYETLKLSYRLKDIPAMDKERCRKLEELLKK